ncbi:MAG: hypothetical protein KF742_01720 [Cryobacterium sp.]|nr:hypothetical protein [Cryobacterium sp.]
MGCASSAASEADGAAASGQDARTRGQHADAEGQQQRPHPAPVDAPRLRADDAALSAPAAASQAAPPPSQEPQAATSEEKGAQVEVEEPIAAAAQPQQQLQQPAPPPPPHPPPPPPPPPPPLPQQQQAPPPPPPPLPPPPPPQQQQQQQQRIRVAATHDRYQVLARFDPGDQAFYDAVKSQEGIYEVDIPFVFNGVYWYQPIPFPQLTTGAHLMSSFALIARQTFRTDEHLRDIARMAHLHVDPRMTAAMFPCYAALMDTIGSVGATIRRDPQGVFVRFGRGHDN